VRRQLSATVATTATTLACVASLVGIPLGLIGGQWAWDAIANALGVPSEPTVSIPVITLVVMGMLLAANLIALLPAALARRTNPATALHAE
jgi:ABC-type antimicrobial peptide transport system permease subunit